MSSSQTLKNQFFLFILGPPFAAPGAELLPAFAGATDREAATLVAFLMSKASRSSLAISRCLHSMARSHGSFQASLVPPFPGSALLSSNSLMISVFDCTAAHLRGV